MTVMVARSAKSTGQQWLFRLQGVPKPSHLESQNGVYQRYEFPGARRFSHLGRSGANRPASSGCSGSRCAKTFTLRIAKRCLSAE